MSETRAKRIARAFVESCRDEIEAPKPGNVHVFAEGHGMTVEHFLQSAAAAAAPLCRHGASVGARILGAVEATTAAVGLNTNLGIVLLCAPLAAAAERDAFVDDPAPRAALRQSLRTVLRSLTVKDAQSAFDAIVRAAPAGLGQSARHDVHAAAETSLLEAMEESAGRDRVAYQYASDYADVFDAGLRALDTARGKGWPAPWPAVAIHLAFLAEIADSHVARKNGPDAAEAVRNAAIGVRDGFMTKSDPATALADLLEFDRKLKDSRLNPGTTADLTVATLFADRLTRILIQRGNND